jgi:hypothetical protein
MKRMFLAAIIAFISLPLTGCGDGDSSAPPTIVTQILSNAAFDGDIAHDLSTAGMFTVTQGSTQSVFAGIDPDAGTEYRAFLDFPLGGVGGIPGCAIIESATLDIVIDSILPNPLTGSITLRIDLVSFQPPTLIETDFSRTIQPALETITISIFQVDLGHHVYIDVTSLMMEAQRLGLPDLQVRILEDLGSVSPGLIEINDTTVVANRGLYAPLLQVSYF